MSQSAAVSPPLQSQPAATGGPVVVLSLGGDTAGQACEFVEQIGLEAVVLEARVMGLEVEALCGKRWVPSRDPQRFPVCPACKERAQGMRGAT